MSRIQSDDRQAQALHQAFGGDADGPELDLRSILDVLRRQARLIIASAISIVTLALVVTLSITPVYTASTLVVVDPRTKNLLDPSLEGGSTSSDSLKVDTEAEILKSDDILMQVISDKGLITDAEFGVKIGLRQKLKALLRMGDATLPTGDAALAGMLVPFRNALTVKRRGLTYLISVDFTSKSPEKAAELSNAIANAYIKKQVQDKVSKSVLSRDVVQQEAEKSRDAVVSAESKFNEYITGHLDQFILLTGSNDLAKLRDDLNNYASQKSGAAAKLESLKDSVAKNDFGALSASLQSDAAKELAKQRGELEAALASVESGSNRAVNLEKELKAVEKSLLEESKFQAVMLENSIASNEADLTNARQNLNAAVLNSKLPPDVLAQIYGLQQMAKNATSTYQALLSRSQDFQTEAFLQVADSRIVSTALPPVKPSFPNVRLLLGLALLASLAVGTALAFLFENFIGGFTSDRQVEAVTGLHLATVLPKQQLDPNSATVADALIDNPLSRYSESVRRLRAAVDRRLSERTADGAKARGVVIMVSSGLPGEGKTTVSVSLARTYALAGQKAIIIDCDMRKPSVHRHLNVESSTGLVDFLNGELPPEKFAQIVIADPKSALTAIVGSRRADLPTDQLVTKRTFNQLIEGTTKRFDVVILDTPPIEPVVDGLYLAQHADVIVFVVQWAKTAQRTVSRAIKALMGAKPANVPMVAALNQQAGSNAAYSSSYASYYVE